MTPSESEEPVELACNHCGHLYMSNLGVMVLGDVRKAPEGGPGPWLNFCSPECSDAWHAQHA